MDIEFKSNNQELAQYGILDIYIKNKLKNFYSKNIQKSINPKQQEIIINDSRIKFYIGFKCIKRTNCLIYHHK